MNAPPDIRQLVERFQLHRDAYRSARYNETQVRREFVDPFFKALGWDVDNEQGYAEAYKDVIHEDALKFGGSTKAPDYCFRIGGVRKYFVATKRPSVNLKLDPESACQLRRCAWSALRTSGRPGELERTLPRPRARRTQPGECRPRRFAALRFTRPPARIAGTRRESDALCLSILTCPTHQDHGDCVRYGWSSLSVFLCRPPVTSFLLEPARFAATIHGCSSMPTLGYVLGAYPWAEQNFFYTWLSSTGENIAPDWPHSAWLARYVIWNWIEAEPVPLEFAYGDTPHTTNRLPGGQLYTHMANIRHLFGRSHPEAAVLARYVQDRLPNPAYSTSWFIYPFLLTQLDDSPPPASCEWRSGKAAHGTGMCEGRNRGKFTGATRHAGSRWFERQRERIPVRP